MAGKTGRIDGRRAAVERIEIGRERRIGVTGLVADQVERRRWRTAQAEGRQADAAVADDDGGHALAHLHRHGFAEIALSTRYRKERMFAAILCDRRGAGYVRHIGWGRTVSSEQIP